MNPASLRRSRRLAGAALFAAAASVAAPIAQAATVVAINPAGATTYTVQDLGVVGDPAAPVQASAINARGDVLGTIGSADNPTKLFLYRAGRMGEIIGLANHGSPAAINSADEIVGTDTTAWLFDGKTLLGLGTLGGASSRAAGVNDADQVVGDSDTGKTLPGTNLPLHQAFRTAAHAAIHPETDNLGALPGGLQSFGRAINAQGDVAGVAETGSGTSHAFFWSPNSGMVDLRSLGGDQSEARAISNTDQVAGVALTSKNERHAFLWSASAGMTDLGTLGGTKSEARGLNAAGQAVGVSTLNDNSTQHAFLFRDGAMTDLNNLLPADAGWVLTDAVAINDLGQIAGFGTHEGHIRSFLLTPPATAAAASTGSSLTTSGAKLGNAQSGGAQNQNSANGKNDTASGGYGAGPVNPDSGGSDADPNGSPRVEQRDAPTPSAGKTALPHGLQAAANRPTGAGMGRLKLAVSTVLGGQSFQGKVLLMGAAPRGGLQIQLASTNPAVTVPASITIPAGATSKSFVVTTRPVAALQGGAITATANGAALTQKIAVRPIGAASVSVSADAASTGRALTGTVTLESPAAPGPIVVTLTTSQPAVADPAVSRITIPAGSTRATFELKLGGVSEAQRVTVTVEANAMIKDRTFTVSPSVP